MKTKSLLLIMALILFWQCSEDKKSQRPPLAKVNPVEDVYFGKKISDPYRYMEDLKDSVVKSWFKSQYDYSSGIINSIPGRKSLIDKMVEFDSRVASRVALFGIADNDMYFYLKTRPEDETGKLFCRIGYSGGEVLLFDPEKWGSDTTLKFVISNAYPSFDGKLVAFEIAPNGSENSEVLIMDVEKKALLTERIDRCWNSYIRWLDDSKSFFYNRLQSADIHSKDRELNSKVFLHKIGTSPDSDKEMLSSSLNPELHIKPEEGPIIHYDRYSKTMFGLVTTVENALTVYYAPLSELKKERITWKPLFKPSDEVYNFLITEKDLFVYTPKNAPHFKIIKTSLAKPDLSTAEVIVPEDPKRTMTSIDQTIDGLYYTLSENGVTSKCYFLRNGEKNPRELKLPFPAGTVTIFARDAKSDEIWITAGGWTTLPKRFRYALSEDKLIPEELTSPVSFPEYDDLTVEELMIPSHDGVMVPLSLIYKKSLVKDGGNPVFIRGYGAYGISGTPGFSSNYYLWIDKGGIIAVAHVRGGGELGNEWYKAGFKTTKPNTWKDLIACAEYLIKENYTVPGKIAINGGSAGGVLIGRAMTERPDLFAAAIPEVGCMNPLRMEESPNGLVNAPEFGTVKDSVECMALIEMDSYLQIREGEKYPATLITAGMNDPRVIAWQPAKFAARLQAANGSDKPILFLPDYEAGHGIGSSKTKNFERIANALSFALWQTGHPEFQIK
jgi:prolyl oligopeptidase